jgi:hypothetical protein
MSDGASEQEVLKNGRDAFIGWVSAQITGTPRDLSRFKLPAWSL